MKILNTKIGKILTTDWLDIMVYKIALKMYGKDQTKIRIQKQKLIEIKKKIGLTEEERLCPLDSNCDHEFIKEIEILGREPFYEDNKKNGEIIHQKVTYIDDSVKNFDIHMILSAPPILDNIQLSKTKQKKK